VRGYCEHRSCRSRHSQSHRNARHWIFRRGRQRHNSGFIHLCRLAHVPPVRRDREIDGEFRKLHHSVAAAHRNAVPGCDREWPKLSQQFHRLASALPVAGGWFRRTADLLKFKKEREGRIQIYRAQGVAGQQRTILAPVKCDMTGRVPRSMMPFPTRQSGSFPLRFERPYALSQILHWRRDKASQACEKTAHCRIGRRIFRFAGEIGHLKRMRENRNVPYVRKIQRTTRVVHVTVREKNCGGACGRAIDRFRCFLNLFRVLRSSGVHQRPRPLRWADKVDVRDADLQAEDVACDLLQRHNTIL